MIFLLKIFILYAIVIKAFYFYMLFYLLSNLIEITSLYIVLTQTFYVFISINYV
ncbi:protein of unknown function [Xenorhabdus poinarii G6]|uniref:Uncharacterized protein n=1 Tax=Xenorhabdus poinarii G6 TaxID=1354304 RepID=A0A068R5M8_9GAMM|nr:protein of unknown function [Xenorhabdus poinarii G6]